MHAKTYLVVTEKGCFCNSAYIYSHDQRLVNKQKDKYHDCITHHITQRNNDSIVLSSLLLIFYLYQSWYDTSCNNDELLNSDIWYKKDKVLPSKHLNLIPETWNEPFAFNNDNRKKSCAKTAAAYLVILRRSVNKTGKMTLENRYTFCLHFHIALNKNPLKRAQRSLLFEYTEVRWLKFKWNLSVSFVSLMGSHIKPITCRTDWSPPLTQVVSVFFSTLILRWCRFIYFSGSFKIVIMFRTCLMCDG